jgi:hypothetical protein
VRWTENAGWKNIKITVFDGNNKVLCTEHKKVEVDANIKVHYQGL